MASVKDATNILNQSNKVLFFRRNKLFIPIARSDIKGNFPPINHNHKQFQLLKLINNHNRGGSFDYGYLSQVNKAKQTKNDNSLKYTNIGAQKRSIFHTLFNNSHFKKNRIKIPAPCSPSMCYNGESMVTQQAHNFISDTHACYLSNISTPKTNNSFLQVFSLPKQKNRLRSYSRK